jgi:hypothetical protein
MTDEPVLNKFKAGDAVYVLADPSGQEQPWTGTVLSVYKKRLGDSIIDLACARRR